jgi:hypothetical protein
MESKWREILQARCARLAPSTPAAHQILMRFSKSARSTSRTSALSHEGRGTADDAACDRAGASGAAATFLSMRVCRRSVASHARLLARSTRPQHRCKRGLRPHRRLRRQSARPSDALRCCRIRLHWPATTPRPCAIPPNGRGLRMKL